MLAGTTLDAAIKYKRSRTLRSITPDRTFIAVTIDIKPLLPIIDEDYLKFIRRGVEMRLKK
jgi:hypothetical protein